MLSSYRFAVVELDCHGIRGMPHNDNETISPLLDRSSHNNILLPLFFRDILFDEDLPAGCGINPGKIHQAGISRRKRRKNLDLLQINFQLSGGERFKFAHIFFGASRVGSNKVISKKLFLPG